MDTTGLSRGVSCLQLHHCFQKLGLDATALCRGGSRSQLDSSERETPRDEPVASSRPGLSVYSGDRESPRDKARGILFRQ